MEDLIAWLARILDEDTVIATNDLTPGPWTVEYECPEGEHDHDWDEVWVAGKDRSTVAGFNERYTCAPQDAAYVVHFQPDAVLARIAADRQILALHSGDHECPGELGWWGPSTKAGAWCPSVRLLAAPHAGRPGYREEWRP